MDTPKLDNTRCNTSAKNTDEDATHQTISSYFIGPKAENLDFFKENINVILDELKDARLNYCSKQQDDTFITEEVKQTAGYIKAKSRLSNAVKQMANLMGRTSIPFWSPRYQAHMCTDMSMASLLGYFTAMLYNPNNVALEASPISTVAEMEVGKDLCELFGYSTDSDDPRSIEPWGHVTCGGTALKPGAPLDFLAGHFHVDTCQGEHKLLAELSTWELLNLKPHDVLDLPDRLFTEHGVSNAYLSAVMGKFTIQSTGKDVLEVEFDVTRRPGLYMLANTRHYSWPKGAAITGLGSDNVIGIPVDDSASLDISALEARLEKSLSDQQPVYAVVAIIGSTEEGAVDPLDDILALRKQFQARGLSFLVHADAAWGGYFCSMLPKNYHPGDTLTLPLPSPSSSDEGPTATTGAGFVPDASLRPQTLDALYAMRFADSVTVDPHKAGYIPYPAGGLCYRDGRMRFLVTWTSPYLSRGSITSIGIYGVEGSKPGAAAMSTWLSNKVIGLSREGYGALLAEVTWTCTRLSAEWAALTDSTSPFVCVPFNKLPCELDSNCTSQRVEAEKARIKRDIVSKSNEQIVRGPDSEKTMSLMRALGSDLNINAFALNFRYSDGRLNDDVEEANYLMQRVIEALSVDSPTDDPTRIELYLTSTEFSDELYGDCKRTFMKRLGLAESAQDLMVLRNVVMSPFPTDGNFTNNLAKILYNTAAAETEVVRRRNEVTEDFHRFLLQGSGDGGADDDRVFAIHQPMFHVANHRQQLILAVRLEDDDSDGNEAVRRRYAEVRRSEPYAPVFLVSRRKIFLRVVQEVGSVFVGDIVTKKSEPILKNVKVKVIDKIVSRPLNSQYRLQEYPNKFMPFYLYGSPKEANIDHIILRAPNTQLSAGQCTLDLEHALQTGPAFWKRTHILTLDDVYEAPMQPFPPNSLIGSKQGAILTTHRASTSPPANANGAVNGTAKNVTVTSPGSTTAGRGFFFHPGARFNVSIWADARPDSACPLSANFERGALVGRGTLTLGDSVFVDSEGMNYDPFKKVDKISEWRYEFDRIGKDLD